MLHQKNITSAIVEGGVRTLQTFIDENLWDEARIFKGAGSFETEAEKNLARRLLFFAPSLVQTIRELRPHYLCSYLYELAGDFATFYNQDKVAVDEPEIRSRRLLLCARTLTVLETGLSLLGITTLRKM